MRHTRWGSDAFASEVTSIATSRYIAITPQPTAIGCHGPTNGTRTSRTPKST